MPSLLRIERRHPGSAKRRPSMIALAVALVVGLFTSYTFGTGVAHAAPVYEIDGRWEANTPGTVAKGDVVTGVWRVNVNDDQEAPSNDPIDNVTFTVTLQHGLFKALPDLCLTTGDGLDPVSSISDDGRTLTCNLGTVKQGTAVVVQTPIVADGITGDQLSASGDINGEKADLDPIDIKNTFGMDMLWGTPSGSLIRPDTGAIGFDFEWTLFQDVGSDQGPDSVTYNLNISLANGDPIELSQQASYEPWNHACVPYQNTATAEGHPYSSPTNYGGVEKNAPFVGSCELVQTGPTTFRLTLSGIDYSQTKVPTQDSAGNPLPSDQVAIASGTIWLQSDLTSGTSANLSASAPTYTSVTGQTVQDDPTNNRSSKVVTFPGNWSHIWVRTNGGTNWDNTFKLAPGAMVASATGDSLAADGVPDNTVMGDCDVLDSRYTDFDSVQLWAWKPGDPAQQAPQPFGTIAYYVGNDPTVTPGSGGYNPDAFTGCATNVGWTTTEPTDKTTIKAVRWVGNAGMLDGQNFQLRVVQRIQDDAPIGQDIWSWGSVYRNGAWSDPGREGSGSVITPTPDDRYSATNGARDILHVVYAVPAIRKAADRSIVRPGVPATFTLTYSANGAGTIPETVDDYGIVDTLPLGMTYVDGSADPAPTVTTDNQGREVLTWNLDGVPTNVANTLSYQAVAGDSVTPGQTLTNTVTSSLRGETSRPASAQVTTSSSGYTEISKSADKPYIPNLAGDGDGAGSWTVYMRSFDPLPQAYTDTIDILPYNGDKRGTSYTGSYAVTGVDAIAGATVYYTSDPVASLSDDPKDDSNGAPGTIAGATTNWSTTPVANPTAIRVIGPRLDPSATQQFTIHIATDGASDGDKLVNRAQGRAGHTELVMRTSAPITVANYYAYELKKYVQDPNGDWHDAQAVADYPVFHIGDKVTYREVITNVGRGTLKNIDVTDDQQPELGAFHIDSLASGEKQTHEYTVTLGDDSPASIVNTACAQAAQPEDMESPIPSSCDPAGIDVANYVTVKTSDPKPGATVSPGDTVTYTVTVTQQGSSPADAVFSDDLSKVLDDATYNDDVKADIGDATVNVGKKTIAWSGTIPVGGQATITYSVTVKPVGSGDDHLKNVVNSPGCVFADGGYPDCTTEHFDGDFVYSKVSDPKSGVDVGPGQTVDYTLTVTQRGKGAVDGASITDDLSDVLDDATLDRGSIKASSGTATLSGSTLTWKGDLAVEQVVKITYTVTVISAGDNDLINPVSSDDPRGSCDTAVGCEVEHLKGKFVFDKTADPKTGSEVDEGQKITYTVTVTQQGKATLSDASVTDDLSKVLDDARYNGDATASAGKVSVKGDTLTWKGDLALKQVVTITYSVTVNGNGDDRLANVVSSDDPRGACDTAVGCQTNHHVTGTSPAGAGNPPADTGNGGLASTGSSPILVGALGVGLLMIIGGLTLVDRRRRLGNS